MKKVMTIRKAVDEDRDFIFGLSPRLSEVAGLTWHNDSVVKKMQDDYIAEMLDQTSVPNITLVIETNNKPLGFIHAREHKDGISGEACGTVPLLAVSPAAQGEGAGQLLMKAAEDWAKEQGYRLLHLEVFANNDKALGFYKNLGFEGELLHLIKPL